MDYRVFELARLEHGLRTARANRMGWMLEAARAERQATPSRGTTVRRAVRRGLGAALVRGGHWLQGQRASAGEEPFGTGSPTADSAA